MTWKRPGHLTSAQPARTAASVTGRPEASANTRTAPTASTALAGWNNPGSASQTSSYAQPGPRSRTR